MVSLDSSVALGTNTEIWQGEGERTLETSDQILAGLELAERTFRRWNAAVSGGRRGSGSTFACHAPVGSSPGTGDTVVMNTDKIPIPMDLFFFFKDLC